jgi:glucose/arabinose dehydrogenase
MKSSSPLCSALAAVASLAFLGSPRVADAQLTYPPLVDPIVPGVPSSGITVSLNPVLAANLVAPVAGAVAPGDPSHLYVADQPGTIWSIKVEGPGSPSAALFLDVRSLVIPLGVGGPNLEYDERGLLGLAFHPDFERNGLFYTYLSEPVNAIADFSTMSLNNPTVAAANCQNVLLEWHASRNASGVLTVDSTPPRELLRVDKPYLNHNGGSLNFGPDRLLYLTLGDGGAANDEGIGHAFYHGNAQTLDPGNLLGKIIRIDPLGNNSANGKYGIPADNPFVDELNVPHEIWAYGFRNPWRTSFDMTTGELWVADVGQNDIEEIDIARRGRNHGWPIKEGTFLFETDAPNRAGNGYVWKNCPEHSGIIGCPVDLVDPIAEYDHQDNELPPANSGTDTRVAVVGGYVYHGEGIGALRGSYVFGDYSTEIGLPCAGHLWVLKSKTSPIQELNVTGRAVDGPLGVCVLAFAQDAHGELYALVNGHGTLIGVTGQVLKLTAVGED